MKDRKARIAALAAKAGRSKKQKTETEEKQLNFRNYTPSNKALEENVLEKALQEARDAPDNPKKDVLQTALHDAQDSGVVAAPTQKINADLKRRIQPQLDKLEKRTQRAIVEMLRERLEKEVDID